MADLWAQMKGKSNVATPVAETKAVVAVPNQSNAQVVEALLAEKSIDGEVENTAAQTVGSILASEAPPQAQAAKPFSFAVQTPANIPNQLPTVATGTTAGKPPPFSIQPSTQLQTQNGGNSQEVIPPTANAIVPQSSRVSVSELLKVDTATFEKGKEAYTQEEVAQFKGSFNMLRDAITNPKLVGQAIKNIMVMMANNPHLKGICQPEEIGLMVKGIRQSYGVVVAKKNQQSETRSKGKALEQQIDNLLGDFGGF